MNNAQFAIHPVTRREPENFIHTPTLRTQTPVCSHGIITNKWHLDRKKKSTNPALKCRSESNLTQTYRRLGSPRWTTACTSLCPWAAVTSAGALGLGMGQRERSQFSPDRPGGLFGRSGRSAPLAPTAPSSRSTICTASWSERGR